MVSSGAWHLPYSASSPAHKKMSAPSSAGFFDPLTGASKNSAPVDRTIVAISLDVFASTVDTSTYPFPALNPSFAARATASAASGVLTMTNVTSAAAHASLALFASRAPASTTGAVAALVRFHTITSCPAFNRFFAMGTPMIPHPRNAIFIAFVDAFATRGDARFATTRDRSSARPRAFDDAFECALECVRAPRAHDIVCGTASASALSPSRRRRR
mmetsp:Transcript_7233/g.29174  ORF Transcript_7233/g.29174 Transcript_7233/m.29174 type:complete len:216 (+) Transcript_7233:460-1107(+)